MKRSRNVSDLEDSPSKKKVALENSDFQQQSTCDQSLQSSSYINANARNKLEVIAEQVCALRRQTENILNEAKVNQELHRAACNFVKVPGHIYHLYERSPDHNYFSMLSPEEWINPPHQYLGSYRLESDYSWTHLDRIKYKDTHFLLFDELLGQNSNINLQQLMSVNSEL